MTSAGQSDKQSSTLAIINASSTCCARQSCTLSISWCDVSVRARTFPHAGVGPVAAAAPPAAVSAGPSSNPSSNAAAPAASEYSSTYGVRKRGASSMLTHMQYSRQAPSQAQQYEAAIVEVGTPPRVSPCAHCSSGVCTANRHVCTFVCVCMLCLFLDIHVCV